MESEENLETTSVYRVARMDCTSEEQLVRMRLDGISGVVSVRINLEERTVTVTHRTSATAIKDALDSLNLGTTLLEDEPSDIGSERTSTVSEADERRALSIALAINAVFFCVEMTTGIIGRSMGLIADSLDMLADAGVYTLSLVATGGTASRKRSLARFSGYLQLALAFGGLAEVIRRFIMGEDVPNFVIMMIVSALALLANVVTLLVLKKAKSPEAHFQASWIFTANDVKVNTLVIFSSILVAVTDHPAPDLVAGALIFLIVANGARRILALAR